MPLAHNTLTSAAFAVTPRPRSTAVIIIAAAADLRIIGPPQFHPRRSNVRYQPRRGAPSAACRGSALSGRHQMPSTIVNACRPYAPWPLQGYRLRASPVERDVLARIRRPLELVAERIHGADRRLAPSYELRAGSCLAAGRVRELRILSRQARRSGQRLRPRLHLARDFRSPVGVVGGNLEHDPCALDSTTLPASGKQ